jgi:hypothetical protein
MIAFERLRSTLRHDVIATIIASATINDDR